MILQYPHEKLLTVCKKIDNKETLEAFLPHFKKLVSEVEDKALGLAAPQTGLSYCLIWINDFGFMINPQIVSESDRMLSSYESCLSIPDEVFSVQRYKEVTVIYKDHNFKAKRKVFKDKMSIILQHEIDHLKGLTLKETGLAVIVAQNGALMQA